MSDDNKPPTPFEKLALFEKGEGRLGPAPNHKPGVSERTIRQALRARRRIGWMLQKHGPGPEGATCGTCANLVRHKYGSTYRKCRIYGDTRSEATDWRAGWPACGLYKTETTP